MTVVSQQRLTKRTSLVVASVAIGSLIYAYAIQQPASTPASIAAPSDVGPVPRNPTPDNVDMTPSPAPTLPWPASRVGPTSSAAALDSDHREEEAIEGADPDEPEADPYEINEPILMPADDGRISSSFDENLVTAAEDDTDDADVGSDSAERDTDEPGSDRSQRR